MILFGIAWCIILVYCLTIDSSTEQWPLSKALAVRSAVLPASLLSAVMV